MIDMCYQKLEDVIQYLEDHNMDASVTNMQINQEGGMYCQEKTTISLELVIFPKPHVKEKTDEEEAKDILSMIRNRRNPDTDVQNEDFDKAMEIIK